MHMKIARLLGAAVCAGGLIFAGTAFAQGANADSMKIAFAGGHGGGGFGTGGLGGGGFATGGVGAHAGTFAGANTGVAGGHTLGTNRFAGNWEYGNHGHWHNGHWYGGGWGWGGWWGYPYWGYDCDYAYGYYDPSACYGYPYAYGYGY
jgi:hypothetical protein